MREKLISLTELFRENGGKFENMAIGYKRDRGYYCSSIDSGLNATVFCPANLLVDVSDIGINESGLFISAPENYANNIEFLNQYFSLHFGEELVGKYLEEKKQIDLLTEHEKLLLKKINLPNILRGLDGDLAYVKYRVLQAHMMVFSPLGKKVIMPFVTFLNYDRTGAAYEVDQSGITVSGMFDGEVFANYHMGDVMTFLRDHGFVAETMFAYSLPMWLKLRNGITLQINRDISKFKVINGNVRWPEVEKKDDSIIVSWFPMYFIGAPQYTSRFTAFLSHEFNIPAEDIIYSVFQFNLNTLLPIAFSLKNSKNSYVQTVVSGVERQLEMIGGI